MSPLESDGASPDDRTNIETIVEFRDEDEADAVGRVAQRATWEPIEQLEEVALTFEQSEESVGGYPEADVTEWLAEDSGDVSSHDMTVIPLGGYELSYVEAVPSQRSEAVPGTQGQGVRTGRETVYRNPSNLERRALRSDAELLVTQLDDGSFWDAVELRRSLQALAGVDASPLPQPVETPTISVGLGVKVRVASSR
jgi:hypothetical protein